MSASRITTNKRSAYLEALADFELGCKSDIELSELLGISTRQMRRYKSEHDFWEEVRQIRLQSMRNKAGAVLGAVYAGAIGNGRQAAQQQKMYLTMIGYYSEKAEIEQTQKIEIDHTIKHRTPEDIVEMKKRILRMCHGS